RHKFTTEVCEHTLYVETINVNPAGVDADYITDSVSFRLYVGKLDNEHENISFWCSCDSLVIEKIADVDTSRVRQVIDTRVFSIKELKSKGKFD
ncbi:MAG TPA: hypothetical protein VGE79_04120, partial [Niastella sp.]